MATATNKTYSEAVSGDSIFAGMSNSLRWLSPVGLLARSLKPGESGVLSTPSINVADGGGLYPTEGATNDPAIDWCFDIPYSPELGICAGAGGPNGSGATESILLSFDIITNAWSVFRDPFAGTAMVHYYSSNAIDDAGIMYKMYRASSGDIKTWDLATNLETVNTIPDPPQTLGGGTESWNLVHSIAFLRGLGTSGSLIHANSAEGRISRWDKDTNTWSNLAIGKNIAASAGTAHYNHFADKVVVTGGANTFGTYLIDSAGTVTDLSNLPADIYSDANFVPHPTAAKSLLFTDTAIYELDYGTGAWTANSYTGDLDSIKANPQIYPSTLYDMGVILFAAYGSAGTNEVILYKPEL